MRPCFSFFLCLVFTTQLQAQDIEQRFQQVVDSVYAANPASVGFLVHVEAPDRRISWSCAVGEANRQTHEKLLPDQPVLIASNTKPYVAATILRLVEQGKIQVDQPIGALLTPETEKRLSAAGYQTGKITLKHLLSHTSGIRDYVDEAYFQFVDAHRNHAWTRDEQIVRAMQAGSPYTAPGDTFRYADINYVLLTEVIETCTRISFYEAIRSLLGFKRQRLPATWFVKLEKIPAKTAPMAHQYWDKYGWDTYDLDPSWDLYGGGGMASTVKDMALFFRKLFEGKIIRDREVLAMMYRDVPPNLEINYCLGIRKITIAGLTGYNHGGGLGTDVVYVPELNATIAVAVLEASHRPGAQEISKEIARLLRVL